MFDQQNAHKYFKLERNYLKNRAESMAKMDISNKNYEELEDFLNYFEYLERLVYFIKVSVNEP